MKILVSIDDTDNLYSRGTGDIASSIAEGIQRKGWGSCSEITRHQLLVHPDIPYTSHNSSMCFAADVEESKLIDIIDFASEYLSDESAEGSDPGLCVAIPDKISDIEQLILFGRTAKEQVVSKESAYELAKDLGIHLSEHGGTGIGVIGALAGAGLRCSQNDGRIKGKILVGSAGEMMPAGEILARSKMNAIKALEGHEIGTHEMIRLGDKVKAVFLEGKTTILVFRNHDEAAGNSCWQTCTKQQLKDY